MTERIRSIVSDVRHNLREISSQNLQNEEIYLIGNSVQAELMRELKGVERSFEIYLIDDEPSYDFADEECLFIKKIMPSWDGNLLLKNNSEWDKFKDSTGSHPVYITVFGGKMYVAPKTVADGDYITVWAVQTEVIDKMDENTDPETPKFLDNILALGICAEFDDSFIPKYRAKVDSLGSIATIKHSRVVDSEW